MVAAVSFLRSRGAQDLFLVGASVGANLSLQYLAERPEARGAVLLSPGLEYRGITTEGLMSRLNPHQGVYAAASEDDPYSAATVKKLFADVPATPLRLTTIFRDAGHGTTMLERHPEFIDELIRWLRE